MRTSQLSRFACVTTWVHLLGPHLSFTDIRVVSV